MTERRSTDRRHNERRNHVVPRVLIADDYADTLTTYRCYWEKVPAPFTVTLVASGAAALEAYQTALSKGEPFALLVLDISMSDMSGLRVAEDVRRCGDDETKIMFVSGIKGAIETYRSEDVQAVAYLTKPVLPAELQARICEVLAL
jgi:CheY-like chemotaxis protein